MAWHARLDLEWRMEAGRCLARHSHEGPLRVLQTLYPEGDAIAHNVMVHPPGGLVGGDELAVTITAGAGAHGLVTTPGAGRFYRSAGATASQCTRIRAAEGARVEWLPLEAIFHGGCRAVNDVAVSLEPGAEMVGWDVMALGLPGSGQPFTEGRIDQRLCLEGAWLEQGRIDAADARLMDGPLGLAGNRCLGTLFFAAGVSLARGRRDEALAAARDLFAAHPDAFAGATSPCPQVVVVRAAAPLVEPVMDLFRAIRACWRPLLWALPPVQPRTWSL